METMYFILGMLSIVGAALVAVIVWGVVKIVNLLKAIRSHEEWLNRHEHNMYENVRELRQDIDRRLDNMERHADKYTTNLQRELDEKFNAVYSYTDSRLDKLAEKTLKQEKQLIKG